MTKLLIFDRTCVCKIKVEIRFSYLTSILSCILSLSIFVGSSNVYLELKRGVPRIHLISIHYIFITPLYVCVFVMFFCTYCYISINFHCNFNIFKFKLKRSAALVQSLSFSLLLMNDGNSI